MARRSQHENFKSRILEQFAKGRLPKDIYSEFPNVPKTTIRDWYADFVLSNSAGNSAENSAPAAPTAQSPHEESDSEADLPDGEEPTPPPDNVRTFPLDEACLPDINRIKRELWRHIRKPKRESGIVAQLANSYMRAIEIEDKLEARNETAAEAVSDDDERAEKIAQILDAARKRRDGQVNRDG